MPKALYRYLKNYSLPFRNIRDNCLQDNSAVWHDSVITTRTMRFDVIQFSMQTTKTVSNQLHRTWQPSQHFTFYVYSYYIIMIFSSSKANGEQSPDNVW